MKKIIITLFLALFAIAVSAQDTMYIHQTGGNVIFYPVVEIDSIVFYSSGTSGPTVVDIDGNIYNIITIGSQEWIGQNLKTTHFNDGSPIPNVIDEAEWISLATPGYCWYNNDQNTYKNTYGALYNWYTIDVGNLCPEGWHVPTDADWTQLVTFLGGENTSRGKLKETDLTHWNSPNTGATNDFNFTALPGGIRSGEFNSLRDNGYWWSTDEAYPSSAWFRWMQNSSAKTSRHHLGKTHGFSVRCIKD